MGPIGFSFEARRKRRSLGGRRWRESVGSVFVEQGGREEGRVVRGGREEGHKGKALRLNGT